MLEIFDIGPCDNGYQMGFLIGCRFASMIKSRVADDLILQSQLLPFAQSHRSEMLIRSLSENNNKAYPRYWDELRGTADGSGVPLLHVCVFTFLASTILKQW